LNLIVTCPRKYEEDAKQEIEKILNDLGDTNPEINILYMPGILTVDTQVEYSQISKSIIKKINDEPWSLRFCLRIVPVQSFSETKIEEITHSLMKLTNVIKSNQSFRITIEKRNSTQSVCLFLVFGCISGSFCLSHHVCDYLCVHVSLYLCMSL